MSAVKIVGTLIVGLTNPWWVYAIIVGILISGYLSFKYTKADKVLEERWIEQEGETFMEPIRERYQNKQIKNQ